ncbi:hypothetical protein SGRA_1811 [Saprospira grandis str. Lewin]|uniref:Uncharacterized protein n=1 Tax=Saprospira grandis (strain Lewin) TaxID=984262 RepID=H6L0L0_SAPGL|nr:hypothetical protein SGRA_1811 [Saprospira grandis str. Lewin]
MRKGAAKPQTQAVRPQGRADLRALKRSARQRREAPKKSPTPIASGLLYILKIRFFSKDGLI